MVKQARPRLSLPWRRFRRIGCGVLLVIWFAILLLPCALFILATQGSIVLHHAFVPEPEAHPLLQIDLLTEADYRGLRIVTTRIYDDGAQLCVQSNVSYVMWLGDGAPSIYCDCYIRESSEADWILADTIIAQCP